LTVLGGRGREEDEGAHHTSSMPIAAGLDQPNRREFSQHRPNHIMTNDGAYPQGGCAETGMDGSHSRTSYIAIQPYIL